MLELERRFRCYCANYVNNKLGRKFENDVSIDRGPVLKFLCELTANLQNLFYRVTA